MPIYATICESCGNRNPSDFHRMAESHSPCEKCGGSCRTDVGSQLFVRERHFAGSERMSLQFGFHPDEVDEARQEFQHTGAQIDDEGGVFFDNRSQERAFRRHYSGLLKKADSNTKE